MTYPKPVMKLTELQKMGFPYEYLMRVFRVNNRAIAWKMNPAKRNSPIIFDTEEFEKFRKNESRIKWGEDGTNECFKWCDYN